jgi:DNA-directed RNA polymerase sigma subunit (sigma70/sigma32)
MIDLNEVVRKNIIIIMNQKKITIPDINVIYFYRKISLNKKTLQALGNEFNISKERVRQIQKKIEKQNDK